jgi:hypothetical protein
MTGPVPDDRPESSARAPSPDPAPEPTSRAPSPESSGAGEIPAWAKRRDVGDPLTDERLAAFIGPQWPRYRRKLAAFRDDPSFVPTWNWSAFFALEYWFLYRKLYLAFAAFFFLPGIAFRWLTGSAEPMTMQSIADPANVAAVRMLLAVRLSAGLAAGGTANWLLFRRARAAAWVIRQQQLGQAESLALLQRLGGVNRGGTILFLLLSAVLVLAQLGGGG